MVLGISSESNFRHQDCFFFFGGGGGGGQENFPSVPGCL